MNPSNKPAIKREDDLDLLRWEGEGGAAIDDDESLTLGGWLPWSCCVPILAESTNWPSKSVNYGIITDCV